jgi:hypothetical protein
MALEPATKPLQSETCSSGAIGINAGKGKKPVGSESLWSPHNRPRHFYFFAYISRYFHQAPWSTYAQKSANDSCVNIYAPAGGTD